MHFIINMDFFQLALEKLVGTLALCPPYKVGVGWAKRQRAHH